MSKLSFLIKEQRGDGLSCCEKHAQPSWKQSTFCPSCEQELPSYYIGERNMKQHNGNPVILYKVVEEEGEGGETLNEDIKCLSTFSGGYGGKKWET